MVRRLMGEHPFLTLGTIATTAVLISNYGDENVVAIQTLEQCRTHTGSVDVCLLAMRDAEKDHLYNAPRFSNMPACEMNYGERKCEVLQGPVPNNPTGQSVYTPRITGFYLPSGLKTVEDYRKYRKQVEEEQQQTATGSTSGSSSRVYGSSGTTIYRSKNGEQVVADLEKRADAKRTGQRDAISMTPFNSRTYTSSRGGYGRGHSAVS
jgi:uncharacterized protein YgiB involved in biofilm formation